VGARNIGDTIHRRTNTQLVDTPQQWRIQKIVLGWGRAKGGGCAQTVADTEDRARLCPQFGLWVLHYSETLTLTLAFAMIDFGFSGPRL